MTKKKLNIAVLGAGISGLTTAYALSKKNFEVTVYEKETDVGGAIKTFQKGDWLVEEGPNTIMVRSEEIWKFLYDLDLQNYIMEANTAAKKRFIVKDSSPIPFPMSAWEVLTTDLISAGAKLRLLKEPFVSPSVHNDETIASFITRRLGTEPLNYAINPFVSGIYAGDPKKLSIKHTFETLWEMEQNHGSLLKGMMKRDRKSPSPKRALISFEKGNQTLAKKLAEAITGEIITGATISSVSSQNNSWQVEGESKGKSFLHNHDVVVSALPAHTLPSVFDMPELDELDNLPYAPLSVIALGFSANQIEHPIDGFGMLIPEIESYRTLGVLFSSALFSNRAPENHELLTCFIGGARNLELASQPKEKLQAIVLEEINELLGISGQPIFKHHRFWEQTIPQYEVGYDQFLEVMAEIETQHPTLFIEGNFRGGVSVPDCISSGLKTAKKVQKAVKTTV